MSEDKNPMLADMKGEVQAELHQLEQHLSEMDKMKAESINKIEARKSELRRYSEISAVREEHVKIIAELQSTKEEIAERKLSIAFMDQTIANLDEQVAAIQAEHDRITGEVELKKNRLEEKIRFYEELNRQIEKLVNLLKNEELLFKNKLEYLLKQKEGLKNNTELSADLLEQALKDLDAAIEHLKQEHDAVQNQLKIKLSTDLDDTMREQVIAEIDRKMVTPPSEAEEEDMYEQEPEPLPVFEYEDLEIAELELGVFPEMEPGVIPEQEQEYGATEVGAEEIVGEQELRVMTEEERITKHGLTITPSGRVIMDDRVISLEEAEMMGLLQEPVTEGMEEAAEVLGEVDSTVHYAAVLAKHAQMAEDFQGMEEYEGEEGIGIEEEIEEEKLEPEEKKDGESEEIESKVKEEEEHEKDIFGSYATHVSTTAISDESSETSILSSPDVDYLKRIFGKALSLALAEITQVQPFDPIHYLAHWLFKYRYNQEIDLVKQREVEALLAERKRLEDEQTHEIIESEAKQAVLDAWLRAEDMILMKDMIDQYQDVGEEEIYEH